MSTRSKTAVVLASAGVLVAGWQLGTAHGTTVATPQTTSATTPSTTAPSGTSPSSGTSAGGVSGTFTGDTAGNRFGTVQVTVTLQNGAITDVTAQTTVDEPQSQRYVQRALPVLRTEVIAANSAEVTTVSGATFTSESYLTSLQSALDKAGR